MLFYGLFSILFAVSLGIAAAFVRRFLSNLRKNILLNLLNKKFQITFYRNYTNDTHGYHCYKTNDKRFVTHTFQIFKLVDKPIAAIAIVKKILDENFIIPINSIHSLL